MGKHDKKVRSSIRNFVLALLLLLITNAFMGVVLTHMSKKTLRDQIDQHMLDVANAAAAQFDGDVIKNIKATDKDTEEYQNVLKILRSFQDNIELEYIYGINPGPDDTFTFAIDPDREDPADFGEAIEATDALITASKGKAAVDKTSHSDEWGRFYSAYSPIFDSEGNVVGIIGVDFNADWYDDKLDSHKAATVMIISAALCVGIVLAFIIFSQNRKSFSAIFKQIDEINSETQKLDNIIMESSAKKLDMLPDSENEVLKTLASGEENNIRTYNEYEAVNSNLDNVCAKLKRYLNYVNNEVYIDDTTGVKNKAAYKNMIKELDEQIAAGNADFSVAFFDINGVKRIYTHYGFEAGEIIMFECAKILKNVFGKSNVYHITGDEFVVLINGKSRFDMQDYFDRFDAELESYNAAHVQDNNLSVAKGTATYDPEKHSCYRHVLIETKAACDKDKDNYYGRNVTLN